MATEQRLILPLNKCKVTANYLNKTYKAAYGYDHYGNDYADGREIIASGDGTVLTTGYDNRLGNIIIARHNDCELPDGTIKDLILRYCHLESIKVKAGDKLVQGQLMGITGQTPNGKINGIHLHIEVDIDTKAPTYTPTISTNSNILRAGYRGDKDTTLPPSTVFWLGKGQQIYRALPLDSWTSEADIKLPPAEDVDTTDYKAKYEAAIADMQALAEKYKV